MLDDKNLRDIGQSISEDLHAFSYLKGVARNYDPRKWFAYQLSLVPIEWNESLVTKILETISDARAWQDNFDSIFPSIMHLAVDSKAKGTVRFIFLLCWLMLRSPDANFPLKSVGETQRFIMSY